ncbi:hypothetical protein ElyMa_001075300 [Elysia marginata]|uniref:Secreted protein n=1 Tax=Elysia marginata TaxID=1093978 RepID=A0AAV4HS71_9GAST|nr:hypothetical protein ElyMa_001075300 [Elysia marginata]
MLLVAAAAVVVVVVVVVVEVEVVVLLLLVVIVVVEGRAEKLCNDSWKISPKDFNTNGDSREKLASNRMILLLPLNTSRCHYSRGVQFLIAEKKRAVLEITAVSIISTDSVNFCPSVEEVFSP